MAPEIATTGHDMPAERVADVLTDLRPSIVIGESTTDGALSTEVVVEQAFNKVTGLTVPMGNDFKPQFVASYIPRSAPWACNYSCGGADHPGLFGDWDALQAMNSQEQMLQADKRWRRTSDEPLLWPGAYAQLLATRPEMQLAADWMLVPSARNLHWRYEVLHSAFIMCKQRLSPDADRQQNMADLVAATKRIWEHIANNTVTIKGMKRPINGRVEVLFHDDAMDDLGKLILRSYLNTTRHIAGCQALRQKMGHILFGFRVVHGECIFVTVSPNRRHSSLLCFLSRARCNDTGLLRADSATKWRARYAGPHKPAFFY